MTKERIAELRKTVRSGFCNTPGAMSECLDEIERLERELEVLKQSRAAAVDQEQLIRNECNRLRALLAGRVP